MQIHVAGEWSTLTREAEPIPAVDAWLRREGLGPCVYIAKDVLANVSAYLKHDTSREHGGFILGKIVHPHENTLPPDSVAWDHVPCPMASGSLRHLTFGHECWQEVYRTVDANDQRLVIVGWFHSHPGMTLRPSARDEFIQRSFFSEPWQVAWICDPLVDAHAFYTMRNDSITAISNIGLLRTGAPEQSRTRCSSATNVSSG